MTLQEMVREKEYDTVSVVSKERHTLGDAVGYLDREAGTVQRRNSGEAVGTLGVQWKN